MTKYFIGFSLIKVLMKLIQNKQKHMGNKTLFNKKYSFVQ